MKMKPRIYWYMLNRIEDISSSLRMCEGEEKTLSYEQIIRLNAQLSILLTDMRYLAQTIYKAKKNAGLFEKEAEELRNKIDFIPSIDC